MEYIASLGGACIVSDMRGHGETSAPADYGYFGADGVAATLADLHQIGDVLRFKYPGLPMILLGHSMGSLVARAYAAERDEYLSALILSGEASNNPAVGAGLLLTRLMALFRGERHISPLVANLATGAYDNPFRAEAAGGGEVSVAQCQPGKSCGVQCGSGLRIPVYLERIRYLVFVYETCLRPQALQRPE